MEGLRAFSTAGRYVQGPGALKEIGALCAGSSAHALLIVDAFMADRVGPAITSSLHRAGIRSTLRSVADEVTQSTVDRVARDTPEGVDLILGVGGGKTIDLAKGVSRALGVPIVTVPTVASNDSPASRAIAMYDDQHHLVAVPVLEHNPILVIVDTSLIAQAPPRFLSAGIGDALSKHFEVDACRAAGGLTMQGTRGLRIASIVARGCYDTLREHGRDALLASTAGRVDESLEETVEAIILLSGMSFENGGLSLAHAMTRGLMAVQGAAGFLHGEHVAYGTLVQLAVTGHGDAEVMDLMRFLRTVSLPSSLAALGVQIEDREAVSVIAGHTVRAPHITNLPAPLSAEGLVNAMRRVESLSTHLGDEPPRPY
ncbi:glycerol dehydrogenase [Cnuibacter physcomitrellae]|uniref:Uncharacterized protein n=1 Tax=Cnuibacter physcomitrellae TaxID=1619308 RepID=A0A1X9LR62_9MICO|nr:glycerol dehydrogenase [Cnuibacter physcomitrellae]ARJ07675.1 hypothetical protein B5808_20080 [Cnuibacter physcomitrellae]GGI42626.1 glycerol dehydrogenase [Cnuibacter physcomitrellae]